MAILYFKQDNTEGYTDAELAALNDELNERIEEARAEAEADDGLFDDAEEEQVSKAFHTEVARR